MNFERPEWQQQAACRGVGPDIFYSQNPADAQAARALCNGCPVSAECLEYANANAEQYGLWDGKNVKERRKYSPRRQGQRLRSNAAVCGTVGGYHQHLRHGQTPCRHCRWAHNEAQRIKAADEQWRRTHGNEGAA